MNKRGTNNPPRYFLLRQATGMKMMRLGCWVWTNVCALVQAWVMCVLACMCACILRVCVCSSVCVSVCFCTWWRNTPARLSLIMTGHVGFVVVEWGSQGHKDTIYFPHWQQVHGQSGAIFLLSLESWHSDEPSPASFALVLKRLTLYQENPLAVSWQC